MVQTAAKLLPSYEGNVTPKQAWQELESDPRAQLVDVRTHAEWTYSGTPELGGINKRTRTISWQFYPNFEANPNFLTELAHVAPDKSAPLYFLCKRGGRSSKAALAATEAGWLHCYNIDGGFEGEADPKGRRGTLNGWKADALPWNQA
ncbi:MAG: rhodanese-like domain-containing protein [Alphaproteobacteria bacterium]